MHGSRYLIVAAVFAAVAGVSGCKRDYKAPEPKAAAAGMTFSADSRWTLPVRTGH